VPERHTDFVFSIVAEDLGFVGSTFVLLLIATYFATSLQIAHQSREPFGRLLVVGLTTLFATQTLLAARILVAGHGGRLGGDPGSAWREHQVLVHGPPRSPACSARGGCRRTPPQAAYPRMRIRGLGGPCTRVLMTGPHNPYTEGL
jgi:hypothetical protein